MNDILFKENQKFKQWWLWLILISVNGLFLIGIYLQIVLKRPFGDNPMSNTGLVIAFAFTLILSLLFVSINLQTCIKAAGISVRFFPFHLQFKQYKWDEIANLKVVKYNPLGEYGGWGLRLGSENKKAYNIAGDQGLQITFTNNQKLLIGTQKAQQLKEVLAKIYPAE